MYQRIIKVALMLICFGMQSAFAATGFQDVLNTPAVKSQLASKRLFNGITLAGKRLVAVGQLGTILYSDNTGQTWVQADVPVSSDLVAVNFPIPKQGWAVGHDGVVLHSSDGGASWVKQLDYRDVTKLLTAFYKEHQPKNITGGPDAVAQFLSDVGAFAKPDNQAPNRSFLDVYFENETSGFIVGSFGLIFRTADGGKSWEPWLDRTEDPLTHPHLYSIRPAGDDLVIAGEQATVMKLDRKTLRFRKVKTPYNGTYFGFIGSRGVMMAHGMRGNVYRSADKGATWKKIETDVMTGLMGSAMTQDGRVVLVSQDGDVLISKKDSQGFDRVKMDVVFPTSAVAVAEGDTIVLAGFGGLMVKKLK